MWTGVHMLGSVLEQPLCRSNRTVGWATIRGAEVTENQMLSQGFQIVEECECVCLAGGECVVREIIVNVQPRFLSDRLE